MKNKLLKSILKKGVIFALLLTLANQSQFLSDVDNIVDQTYETEHEILVIHDMFLDL